VMSCLSVHVPLEANKHILLSVEMRKGSAQMGQGVVVCYCGTCDTVGLLTKGMLVVMDVVCAPRAMSTAALNVWCFVVTALIAVVVPVHGHAVRVHRGQWVHGGSR
jgi:hypothetical protein